MSALKNSLLDLQARLQTVCNNTAARPMLLHWSDCAVLLEAVGELEAQEQRVRGMEAALMIRLAVGQKPSSLDIAEEKKSSVANSKFTPIPGAWL